MAKVTASMSDIKTLREKTGAGIMDAKKALEESNGDMKKAQEWIHARGIQLADKKAGREAKEGVIVSYVHLGGKIGTMVELNCETDFVAKTDDFMKLGKEIAMQVASMQPATVAELLEQPYIRDPKTNIRDLIKQVAGKVGENVVVSRFARFALGETEAPKS
ncbi:MAG TPA: translation elongation factor Ts [Candidatus Saccharimonadia bacterium]|nr:translation elongation factor Ts [Candidatus Saccharimonadia bacterium]